MRFIDLMKKLPEAEVRPLGSFVGFYHNDKMLLSIVPCVNYRTKTLTALWSLPGSELDVVNLVVPFDMTELQSAGNVAKLVEGINSKFAGTPSDSVLDYLSNVKLVQYSANGVHMDRCGSLTAFSIANTKFLEFTDLGEPEPKAPTLVPTSSGFEVRYRDKLYAVKSIYPIHEMEEADVTALIFSYVVNVYTR